MDFVTVRELRAESGKVWEKLAAGQEIVITRNGKPFAIMAPTEPAEVEGNLRALRAARFGAALRAMQRHAVETGLDKMTLDEINAEIAAARQERRKREAGGH
ncbi:MAG: type II toxin-antitoxin system Phd/YefM family antitoxin [Panacagrimonas sp.]